MSVLTSPVVSTRALNRATLRRQLLAERVEMGAVEAVEHLVGMQAQAPWPPYTGLWTRLAGFTTGQLADALVDRRMVRIALMRGTVHLVSADDCRGLRPLLQPMLERQASTAHRAALDGLSADEIAEYARGIVEAAPCATSKLGALLCERWPGVDRQALLNTARARLALVQVPPRAVWGRSGTPTVTTAQSWLGTPMGSPDPAATVRRYLAAFGPASVADVQKWSGLTGLREVVAGMDLVALRDEAGRTLYDRPDVELPGEDAPAPVRLLPEFDNVLLSYADNSRVVAAEHRGALMSVNGIVPGTVLVDGFVAATWKLRTDRDTATVEVTALVRLTRRVRADIEAEAHELLAFAAADAAEHEVRIG